MACNSINATLDVFSLTLMGILIISTLLKKKKAGLDWFFLIVLLLYTVNVGMDLVSWRAAGKDCPAAFLLACVSNYITYLCIPLSSAAFLALVYFHITKRTVTKGAASRLLTCLMNLVALFLIGTALVNPWTGFLYSIDKANNFTWGPWSNFLPDGGILIQILLLCPLVFLNQSTHWRKTLTQFLIYGGIPAVALCLEITGGSIAFYTHVISICLLLIYMGAQERQLLEKEIELADSRTKIMISQIQPHFLYNVLSTIRSLCRRDPERAWEALGDFSIYLRSSVDALVNKEPIHFSAELAHIETYLKLEKMRLGDRLSVIYDIQEDDFFLPVLTVQPLVENAVKHGIFGSRNGGTVTLCTRREGEQIVITVTDDGVGFDPQAPLETDGKHTHMGIWNVRYRLEKMSGGHLTIESEPGKGTTAVILLKAERGASDYVHIGG